MLWLKCNLIIKQMKGKTLGWDFVLLYLYSCLHRKNYKARQRISRKLIWGQMFTFTLWVQTSQKSAKYVSPPFQGRSLRRVNVLSRRQKWVGWDLLHLQPTSNGECSVLGSPLMSSIYWLRSHLIRTRDKRLHSPGENVKSYSAKNHIQLKIILI